MILTLCDLKKNYGGWERINVKRITNSEFNYSLDDLIKNFNLSIGFCTLCFR